MTITLFLVYIYKDIVFLFFYKDGLFLRSRLNDKIQSGSSVFGLHGVAEE